MKEVYVLMADDWGSTFSKEFPIGVAVTSDDEAKRYVKEGNVGFSHSFIKVLIFENKDDAIKHLYPSWRKREKD